MYTSDLRSIIGYQRVSLVMPLMQRIDLIVSVPLYPNEQSILSDGGKGASSYERQTIDLKDYPNKVLPLQNVDEIGFLNEEGDMVDLPFLHEVRNIS